MQFVKRSKTWAILSLLLVFMTVPIPSFSQETTKARLPGSSRLLSFNQSSQVLAAPLALQGIAFVKVNGNGLAEVQLREDWPTLYALPLEDGRFLLARRFGKLALVEPVEDSPDYREMASWPVEGLPVHLMRRGKRLYVASGGAGLLIYEWKGGEDTPQLRARYPFVDFSKEITLSPSGQTLLLADNRDTGLQVFNVDDILRPVNLFSVSYGFTDSVAVHGNLAAVAIRRQGTLLFDISDPAKPRVIDQIPRLYRPGMQRPPIVNSVAFDSQGRLLIGEEVSGARLFQIEPGEDGESQANLITHFNKRPELEGFQVLDAIFLDAGRIAVSSYGGEILLLPTTAGEEAH